MSVELGLQVWREPGARGSGLRALARAAESAGYSSLTVPDHLADGMPAPLTTCAVLIGATERIHVGTLVLNNDFRHPVVLAREVAALADLSGGRFELGLGAGHIAKEYARAGLPFEPPARRIGRLEEATEIIRTLLAGDTATCEGEHYTVQSEQIRPAAAHDVPILIGGNSPPLQAVAARCADIVGLTGFSQRRGGTVPADLSTFGSAATADQIAALNLLAAAAGRSIRLQALVQWAQITPNRRRAAAPVAADLGVTTEVLLDSPYVLMGTEGEIVTQLREHRDRLGIARWTVFANRPAGQPPPLRALAPVVERLANG